MNTERIKICPKLEKKGKRCKLENTPSKKSSWVTRLDSLLKAIMPASTQTALHCAPLKSSVLLI